MRRVHTLFTVLMLLIVLAGCGGGGGSDSANANTPALGQSVLMIDGGTGFNGTGGTGGQFTAGTYGSIKVLKSGTVDASFTVDSITPEFGTTHFTVATDTTVPTTDTNDGALCQIFAGPPDVPDGRLYIGDGNNTCGDALDVIVTGLTVDIGATLVFGDLGNGDPILRLDNDLMVNGTIRGDLPGDAHELTIEANVIYVESTGKITASATGEPDGGGICLGGSNPNPARAIINRGTIETTGGNDGSGGTIYLEADELIVNNGTIDASGGIQGGDGGVLLAYVDHGDFYSSGTVRLNGRGAGANGGISGVETAYVDNTMGSNGDIVVSGIWEANGADGAAGGGSGGNNILFRTYAMGNVKVNAAMSVSGGNGTGWGTLGGSGGSIQFVSESINGADQILAAGKMSIAGTFDLSGGDGDANGGRGGGLTVWCNKDVSSTLGTALEFVGFPVISLNGGGGKSGGVAADPSLSLNAYFSVLIDATAVTNQAEIQARGGDGDVATLGTRGGVGGKVRLEGNITTVLDNSGNIDVSGGAGDTGGAGNGVIMAAGHIGNSGNLTANGGNGTTGTGGDGGKITLTSGDVAKPTVNTGTLSVAGGSGTLAGADGIVNID